MTYSISSIDFGREMLERIGDIEQKCNIKLTRYQKILLSEIGTVEMMLSIIADSPINVEVINQLDHTNGIIEREVWLKDKNDNKLLFARSYYNTTMLPQTIASDLLSGRGGIGSILMRYQIETYRKIIKLGFNSDKNTIFREYQIVHDKDVWFTIYEEFNLNLFID